MSTSDHLVRTKVMSVRGGMHPVIALVGVIGGLIAFGVMGFILGPVVLALFVSLLGVYLEQRPSREDEREEAARRVAIALEAHETQQGHRQGEDLSDAP